MNIIDLLKFSGYTCDIIKGYPFMTESKPQKQKSRKEQRFEREAKALQKNLAKRKQQQEQRKRLNEEKRHGQN